MMTNNQNHLLKNDHTQIILSYDQNPLLKNDRTCRKPPSCRPPDWTSPERAHSIRLWLQSFKCSPIGDHPMQGDNEKAAGNCNIIPSWKTGIKMFTNSTTVLGNRI